LLFQEDKKEDYAGKGIENQNQTYGGKLTKYEPSK